MARYKNIAYVATHEISDTGHVSHYFMQHAENFYLCETPPLYRNQPTTLKHYRNGKLVRTVSLWPYKGKNTILILFFYYWSFIIFLATFKVTNTTIIVCSPMYLYMSWIFRLILRNHYVFWIFDYFPNPKGTTRINNAMSRFYNARMRTVIYLSPVIAKIYARKNTPKNHIRKVVGFGIIRKKMQRSPQNNIVGYIGKLSEGKGLHILLEAAAMQKDLLVEIIGDGPSRKALEQHTKKLNIEKRVSFFGFVPDKNLPDITNRWVAGAAMYENGSMNCADYTDPGKIKLYIELGIPIIMTAISSIQTEISNTHAGVIAPGSSKGLIEAMRTIQTNQSTFSQGVKHMAEKHPLEPHYKAAFEFLEHTS